MNPEPPPIPRRPEAWWARLVKAIAGAMVLQWASRHMPADGKRPAPHPPRLARQPAAATRWRPGTMALVAGLALAIGVLAARRHATTT